MAQCGEAKGRLVELVVVDKAYIASKTECLIVDLMIEENLSLNEGLLIRLQEKIYSRMLKALNEEDKRNSIESLIYNREAQTKRFDYYQRKNCDSFIDKRRRTK